MKRTTYQVPELRDENDNIIQEGTFGKHSAFSNSTNDGAFDYILNDLEALHDNIMGGTGGEINTETITGKTGTITNLTATTVKAGTLTADALNGPLTGDVTGNLTGNVTGTADKAIADGKGNNIVNTYVTKSALASSVTTDTGKIATLTATDSTLTNLTVTGQTSVPTANAGNSSKAIASTEFVQGELTNYLPLSGGTMTGSLVADMDEFWIGNKKANNAGSITLRSANDSYKNGAVLTLYGIGASRAGQFTLQAADGTNTPTLLGKADGTLTWNNQPLLPVGIVQAFAGTTIPSGWLLCDGSAVSRTNYAALYAVIGTTYGAGNGSTTFNLPNLVDKFVEGSATSGTVKSAGLPNITGNTDGAVTGQGFKNNTGYKALFVSQTGVNGAWGQASSGDRNNNRSIGFDASRSSAIYGKSDTVQPPALTMRYIIKY